MAASYAFGCFGHRVLAAKFCPRLCAVAAKHVASQFLAPRLLCRRHACSRRPWTTAAMGRLGCVDTEGTCALLWRQADIPPVSEALQWCYYHLPDDGPLQDTLLLCDCVRTILSTHSQRYPDTYARSTVGERRRGCWLPLSEATKLNFETLLDSLRVFLSLTERASFGGVSWQRLGAGWLWQFARAVVGSELRPQLHTGELEPWHLR